MLLKRLRKQVNSVLLLIFYIIIIAIVIVITFLGNLLILDRFRICQNVFILNLKMGKECIYLNKKRNVFF